ncbi:MAG: hypothetical protein H6873_05175 [Hyphomicrobiaceae bacterium]|nr:hypothetical protein [Hyphomicrobiaceae bacterium]
MTTYVGEVLKKDALGNLSIVELKIIDNAGGIAGSEATSQESGVEYKVNGVSLGTDAPEIRSGTIDINEKVVDFLGSTGTFAVNVDYFTSGGDTYYMFEPSFFVDDTLAIVSETLGGTEVTDKSYARWRMFDTTATFYSAEILSTRDQNLTDGLPENSGIQRMQVGIIDDDGVFEYTLGGDVVTPTETGNRPTSMSGYVPIDIRVDFASYTTLFGDDSVNNRPNAVSATVSVDLSSIGGVGADATFTGLLFSTLDGGDIYTFLMVPTSAGIDLSDVESVVGISNVQLINGETLADYGFTTDLYQTDLNNTDDFYYGENWNDLINGLAGRDIIFGETGNDEIHGDEGADELFGGAQNDTLYGGTEDDILHGGIGDDQLFGDENDDTLYGDRGADILNGGDGNDHLHGNEGNDELHGGNNDDVLYGDDGTDSLDGGGGVDNLHGGDGADTLLGKGGDDILRGDDGNDTLNGGDGADTLRGGTGKDELLGKDGNDTIKGEDGNDTIEGGKNDDSLDGGDGNDRITGGDGDDTLYGRGGDDRFTFGKNDDNDVIKDFQNNHDRIDLTAFNFSSKSQALGYFFEKGSNNNDVCGFSKNGTDITIKGVDLKNIDGSDIII